MLEDAMPAASKPRKPDLVIRADDYPHTARDLASIIAASGEAFDRAGPVQVFEQPGDSRPRVVPLNAHSTVNLAHQLARPVGLSGDGGTTGRTLPERVAKLYLAQGQWDLQPLRGTTTAPLLAPDGTIRAPRGYDRVSGLWCAAIPSITVPDAPTRTDAAAALGKLRSVFRTFPFADATTGTDAELSVVDINLPPAQDESAFLAGLLTGICRPSLPLAPGLLIRAPHISGAGTGKGLLVGAISAIAFGIEPRAFTLGANVAELDKRISAALIQAAPVVFLDNANGEALRSDLLASILTQRLIDVRPLGTSLMLPLCPNAFVAVTGNGVSVTEDLARRFLVVELDAHTEDPEARPFAPGFLPAIIARRAELQSAALTIWRWGRQNETALKPGRPLGSFEEWARWVRDPLLALGCADPVERVQAIKKGDLMRRQVHDVFDAWWQHHATKPITIAGLSPAVLEIIDPQGRGRQFVASYVGKLAGTTVNGRTVTLQRSAGVWGAATYALRPVADVTSRPPMPPMVPMTDGNQEAD